MIAGLMVSVTSVQAQFHIIPEPVHIQAGKGNFILKAGSVIGVDKETEPIGRYLQDYLNRHYDLRATVQVYEHIPAAAAIRLTHGSSRIEGAYSMHIGPSYVGIEGNGAGVFYGVQTLIQLLPANAGSPLKVAACDVADEPRFTWRGLSLDVSRHFFTVDEVKKYIDVMAHYKLNMFHWHLTDDEGWRIQIDKYPKLTEVGARISYYAKRGEFRKLDNLNDEGRDGFYTKDDIRDVIKYAQDRFVTILPEIEMPGHSEAAIFAYPQLGCQDSTGDKHRVQILDPSEYTFSFMEDVLTEVIALFPSSCIHIGGDEAEMVNWLKSPTAVALMKSQHLKSEKEVQSYFIKRIEKFLLSKNKRLVGWDEILAGGLAESATVMSWQGEAGGISAAKMHHPVIMTPLPYMYFDAPQANEELEPIGWNPPVPWQMVYNYEPQSQELNDPEASYILGAQGNIWCEKVSNLRHLEYMVYPRALAVAELTWSARGTKDLHRFERTMKSQYGLFRLWDLNARLPDIEGLEDIVTDQGRFRLELTYPLKGAMVRYDLHGKMPDSSHAALPFPATIDVPLRDSIELRTYTTWPGNDQRIRQLAHIRRVVIAPAAEASTGLQPGLLYQVTKGAEESIASFSGFIRIVQEADYELTTGYEISPALFLGNVQILQRGMNRYVEPQRALLHLKRGVYMLSGSYAADEVNARQSLTSLKIVGGRTLPPASYLFHANSKYVNAFIGTSATGHTFPGATVPYGMVQLSPETGNFGWDYCSGYRYEDTVITGFAHTHLSGTGGVDLGDVLFFPFQGAGTGPFRSKFSHQQEKASPGYYEVVLNDNHIKAQLTASAHTGLHRYTFFSAGPAHLLIDMQSGLVESAEQLAEHISEGAISIDSRTAVSGYAFSSQWVDKKVYFTAIFNRAFTGYHFLDGDAKRRLVLDFDLRPGEAVEARVGLSGVSIEGARKNLRAEVQGKTFERVQSEAAGAWERSLGILAAEGSETTKETFYTCLYHAQIQPNNIADVDGRYRGADGHVHRSANKVFYSTLSLWDTYRAAHPLYTIICPDRAGQIVASMLEHDSVAGMLPIWTLWGKESYAMIGNHSVPVIADAMLKGIKGFDRQKAFAAIRRTLTVKGNPKYNWRLYMKYGYLPSDSVPREAVSRTLEAAYDDWCAAQAAKVLHKRVDYAYFIRRSNFYKNLFDSSTRLMRGRRSDGEWVRPFANLDSGQLAIGGDYTEGNAWQYTWQVQHDIPGLIRLMGGKQTFINKLDSLFNLDATVFGIGSTLDVTGLIGQYAHGNEPNHHVAYLYTLAGKPARTQELVRQITDQFYINEPGGLSGNDDCGQMSAWYIFSAMGFYPVNPADGRYVLGAPLLDRVSIALPGGKRFEVEAPGLSVKNKYVQRVYLNGKRCVREYITHRDIMSGGKLVFVMGDH